MGRAWVLLLVAAAGSASPAAPAKDGKSDEASGVPLRLVRAAEGAFVKVHYHFKKDVTEEAGRKSWAAWRARVIERFVDDKITLDAAGIAVGPDAVAVYDNGLEDRFLDRIEVVTADGRRLPARRDKLLVSAPLELLKVSGEGLKPVKFTRPGKLTLKTSLWSAGLLREGDRWRLTYTSLSPSMMFNSRWADNPLYALPGKRPEPGHYDVADTSEMNVLQLLADEAGRAVGIAADELFDAKGTLCTWRGLELLKAPALSHRDLARRRERLRAELLKSIHEVKVKFRQESRSSSELGSFAGREISVYCMALSPVRAVIPRLFNRKLAAKIESIDIRYGPQRRAKCRFLGAYKEFGATMIQLLKGTFPGQTPMAQTDPKRIRPFWAVNPRQKNGKTDVDLTLNRLITKQRGYRNHFHWAPARYIPPGSFVVTMDGKLAGIQMTQRVEDEEQRQLARGTDRLGRFSGANRPRLFAIGEIRDALAHPAAAFDPKIKVLPKRMAKRRHWFGVEYIGMNRDLAEQMKVQKQTKDGTIGFLVSAVYAGSPAEKMGLAVGDILLEMRVEGQPYPVEFKSQLAGRGGGEEFGSDDAETGPLRRMWKKRGNFLTKLLDAIGAGKPVRITYYDADAKGPAKTVTKNFTVQQAPEDFDSAARWKNQKLGLTVKDLTYEVRKALNLSAKAPGVVVARVEPGSPANIARIWANEIITRCDGKPVTSALKLHDFIAAAHKAGKDKVRLTVLRLGRTRFADLSIKDYNPDDDEGLEED